MSSTSVHALSTGGGRKEFSDGSRAYLHTTDLTGGGTKHGMGGSISRVVMPLTGNGAKTALDGSAAWLYTTVCGLPRPVVDTRISTRLGAETTGVGGRSLQLVVYKGRDYRVHLKLEMRDLQTGEFVSVPPDSICRVVLALKGPMNYCIDSSAPSSPISLMEQGKTVQLQLGNINGLIVGRYHGWLTVFDWLADDGIPWAVTGRNFDKPTFDLLVTQWPVC